MARPVLLTRRKKEIVFHCMICKRSITEKDLHRTGRDGRDYIRELPKDDHCQDRRVYHLESCGPGTKGWMDVIGSELSKILYYGALKEKEEKVKQLKTRMEKIKRDKERKEKPEPVLAQRHSMDVPPSKEPRLKPPKKPIPRGNGGFKPGSKTEFILGILKKGISFKDLQKQVIKQYDEKTGGELNLKMYIRNIKDKGVNIHEKGGKMYAE